MPATWGWYKRPDEEQPVQLPAADEDKAAYAAKGFEYLGPSGQPGMEGPPAPKPKKS